MSLEDGEALRAAVAEYLGEAKPKSFPSAAEFRKLPVEMDRQGRIRIGSWVHDATARTLTDHAQPGQRAGYDRVVHLAGQGRAWKVERVSRVEVFGPGRMAP